LKEWLGWTGHTFPQFSTVFPPLPQRLEPVSTSSVSDFFFPSSRGYTLDSPCFSPGNPPLSRAQTTRDPHPPVIPFRFPFTEDTFLPGRKLVHSADTPDPSKRLMIYVCVARSVLEWFQLPGSAGSHLKKILSSPSLTARPEAQSSFH